jgi:hypothetical protein
MLPSAISNSIFGINPSWFSILLIKSILLWRFTSVSIITPLSFLFSIVHRILVIKAFKENFYFVYYVVFELSNCRYYVVFVHMKRILFRYT